MLVVDYDDLESPEYLDPEFEWIEAREEETGREIEVMYYKGKPFTGKAISKNAYRTDEIFYVNGLLDGESNGFWANGQKASIHSYSKGEEIGEGWEWNEKGIVTRYSNNNAPSVERRFDEQGKLYYEVLEGHTGNYYYPSGQLMKVTQKATTKVYAPGRQLAFTQTYNDYDLDKERFEADGQFSNEYNHEVLKASFMDMAGEMEIRNDIIYWLYDLTERDFDAGMDVLIALIGHPNLFVKSKAISIAGDNGYKACVPAIQKELDNHQIPGIEKDRANLKWNDIDEPISETAMNALYDINEQLQ